MAEAIPSTDPSTAFTYTHFEYPFASTQSSPIQPQGIGMSLVNALCSDLVFTVRKREETRQLMFRDGKLHERKRKKAASEETGITVAATIKPQLQGGGVGEEQPRHWLLCVLAASPSLKLVCNDRELKVHPPGDA